MSASYLIVSKCVSVYTISAHHSNRIHTALITLYQKLMWFISTCFSSFQGKSSLRKMVNFSEVMSTNIVVYQHGICRALLMRERENNLYYTLFQTMNHQRWHLFWWNCEGICAHLRAVFINDLCIGHKCWQNFPQISCMMHMVKQKPSESDTL